MIRQVVVGAKHHRRHVGICGQSPFDFPDVARRLVGSIGYSLFTEETVDALDLPLVDAATLKETVDGERHINTLGRLTAFGPSCLHGRMKVRFKSSDGVWRGKARNKLTLGVVVLVLVAVAALFALAEGTRR
jgi:hypothetical protein